MVVDKINKEGGINGRELELVMGDTDGNPAWELTPWLFYRSRMVNLPWLTDA